MPERLAYQEIVDNAQAVTGARLVVFVQFDAGSQEARVLTWAAPRGGVVQRALAAVARVDPHFDVSRVAVKTDVNRLARTLYLEGKQVEAPFQEIARGTVDARIVQVAETVAGLRYGLLCPVYIGSAVVGSLGFYTPQPLTDAQRRTAEAFSRQAALTLENAALLAAERHRRHLAHELHQAALALAAPVPDDSEAVAALLATIVDRAVAVVGACDGWLTLAPDPAWDDLAPGSGPADGHIRLEHSGHIRREVWRAGGVTRHVLATGEPVSEPDTRTPARFGPYPDLVARGIRSRITVPLWASGRVLGALAANFAHVGGIREEDREPLELFAAHAAAALERVRLVHAERRLSEEVQAAGRLREEFVTTAAHDLKNPLATVKGRAQHLRGQVIRWPAPDSEVPGRVLEGLASIEGAADRMAALLDQLLDTARLQSGQPLDLVAHDTDLVALVHRVAANYLEVTERHRLVVRATVPALAGIWDESRLERVLDNLLSNACKYSPGGGEITLTVGVESRAATAAAEAAANGAAGTAPEAGEWAVLTVRDQGLGIPAADLARIFERFARGRNVAGSIAGAGIGLAGARQIVEQHKGTIAVDSREGVGSTFTVRLPLKPGAALLRTPPQPADS